MEGEGRGLKSVVGGWVFEVGFGLHVIVYVFWLLFGMVLGLWVGCYCFFLSEKWSIVSPIILLFLYLMIMSFSVSSESSAFSGLKVM